MDIDYDLGCELVNNLEHWTGYNSGCNVRIMKTLADRLNQRMAEIGMTQDRLGELAGVSQTTIFKLCSGKAKETRKLLAISDALGVSPKWLQHGDGPMRDATVSPESHGLPQPLDEPKPPTISDEVWQSLPPKARALVEDIVRKSHEGKIKEEDLVLLLSTADRLSQSDP